jgi:hypothetical protein
MRIQIGNRALPISAKVVHQVFGLPANGKSLPNYNAANKRAARADLRSCDVKGLESTFTSVEATMLSWGSVKSPGGLLNIMPMIKNLVWMTGLCNHSSCLCSMHCYFPLAATKRQA